MIRKLLIVNRGEIALRIHEAAQTLGIETIGIYTQWDECCTHVQQLSQLCLVSSYTSKEEILAIAESQRADAVHPGYGFLAEDSEFVEQVLNLGLTWVGPHIKAHRALSSKSQANALADAQKVPTLTINRPIKTLKEKDFPLMIKAEYGGGGRGMCRVESLSSFQKEYDFIQKESLHLFGDDHLILESFKSNVRHIEVQLLGDQHGHLIHLYTRDCSVQRRHQKIIESAPALGLSPKTEQAICSAALKMGRALQYDSVGTIEFLVDPVTEAFWFIEGNPRLQVEHGVTEQVTGVDLVVWQLRVASGEPLTLSQDMIHVSGHAIQARIYAEDPKQQWQPSFGQILFFNPSQRLIQKNAWSIQLDSQISNFVDPMMGKMIVHASSQVTAIGKLLQALNETHIGGIANNMDWVREVITHTDYRSGHYTTKRFEGFKLPQKSSFSPWKIATALNLILQYPFQEYPLHWSIRGQRWSTLRMRFQDQIQHVLYCMRDNQTIVFEDQTTISLIDHKISDVTLQIDTLRLKVSTFLNNNHLEFKCEQGTFTLTILTDQAIQKIRSSDHQHHLCAPIPGTVIKVLCDHNQVVSKGDDLLVIEAMKMHHVIKAPHSGSIQSIQVEVGQVIGVGEQLCQVNPEKAVDPDLVA